MEQTFDIKNIQRKSYRFIEQDGLMEVMLGVFLVGTGITLGSKLNSIFVIVAIFVLAPLLKVLRKIL